MSCRRNAAQKAAVQTDVAQTFALLESGGGGGGEAPPLRVEASAAPSPVVTDDVKRKRATGGVILAVLAIVAVSVVASGSGNAPQRPATGGGLGGGIRCALCGKLRSKDKRKPCTGCARKAAKRGK